MENGFGGAKPKTKFVGSREDSRPRNGHVCSKDRHKQSKANYNRDKRHLDTRSLMNGISEPTDSIDSLTHDTDDLLEDSGISNCNNSVFLNESEHSFTGGRNQRHEQDTHMLSYSPPPFMLYSNFSESGLFDDVDMKRNDDDEDFANDIEHFWKDINERRRSDKNGVKNCSKKEDAKPSKEIKQKMTRDCSYREKALEDKKCEVVKRHEDTMREKWKKSGLALRKFLSDKLGINSSAKKEKLDKQTSDDSASDHIHLSVPLPRNSDNDIHEQFCQDTGRVSASQTKSGFKDTRKDKKTKQDKSKRKDSMSSSTGSEKSSRSMMSRFKQSFRPKKKKKENDCVTLSDESYPSSPISHSSSSNGCNNKSPHNHLTHLTIQSHDQSHDQSGDTDQPAYSLMREINDNDLIFTLNLEGNGAYFCDCQMCLGHKHSDSHKKGYKPACGNKVAKHEKVRPTKNKSKKLFKKGKTKKKEYIGILDDALSSEEIFKDEDKTLKRRHKDYNRERLSSNSQDTVTPENTPPRNFTPNNTSDVLSGLHYAIPYLPPRLRERLQTTNQTTSLNVNDRTDDQRQTNAQNTKDSAKKKCSQVKSDSKTKARHPDMIMSHYDSLIGEGCLEDFSNLDKDWDYVVHGTERNNQSSVHSSHVSTSRTRGEISDSSMFNRCSVRPDSTSESYRNHLIDALDRPLLSQGIEELSVEGSNSASTLKEDDRLYDFDDDESLLEDLLSKMDRLCLDDEDNGGMENKSFTGEATVDLTSKYDSENDEKDKAWFPLPAYESSEEADDEFECDCGHCSLLRQQEAPADLHDLDAESEVSRQQRMDEMRFGAENELLIPDPYIDEDLFNINITELTSLDFILMAESTFRLDIMLENVIQQMLAVQPELLNDQAVPPADQSTINSPAEVSLTQEHIDQNPACPICLCPCEIEEVMTSLVCSHFFHPLCIQAWLSKSGTCPVCRSPV